MTELVEGADGAFAVGCAGFGVVVGAWLVPGTRRLIRSPDVAGSPVLWAAGPLATGLALGLVAAWTGPAFELLLFGYVAVVGIVLAVVDVVERRLPGIVVLPSYVVVGVMLAAHAMITGNTDNLVRAVVGSGALAGFYLALALATRGGLGAGDVKLAGLLGLTSGWIGWPALLWSTFLAWAFAGVTCLLLALTRRSRLKTIPLGPFLLLGSLCSVGLIHP